MNAPLSTPLPFIDTHCHIDSILERINGSALVDGSAEIGNSADDLICNLDPAPKALIHIACDPKDFSWGKDFLGKKSISGVQIYGAFGVHPLECEKYNEQAECEILECLKLQNAVALGEIGLDYHYAKDNAELQKKIFLRQIEIGLDLKIPFVFHLREAEEDAFEILKKIDSENIKAHIHCYTGTADFAKKILTLKGNYFFGFTGAVTFNKAENVRDAAKVIPLDKLLLETDAPYLAPAPFRGKTALPSMIPQIAAALAAARSEPLETVMNACFENSKRFYGIEAGGC